MTTHVEIRKGQYVDSVSLMQVSSQVAAVDGVAKAQVAMATELNLDLLAQMGFDIPRDVTPNDMVVAVVSEGAALAGALAVVDTALAQVGRSASLGATTAEPAPRNTAWGVRTSGAPLALVSVPGPHAFTQAAGALGAGSSVMIFSDNVPIAHEVRLKEMAAERDLIVMGPDCGTAIVSGTALGFANVVARGPVGVAAASGTGAQELTSLLHMAGAGVSHCLGLGGRDLSEQVGGRSARAALAALDADPGTELIVLVSKPPHPTVAEELRAYAATLRTPVQFALLGPDQPTMTEAVETALTALGRDVPEWPSWMPEEHPRASAGGALRGLFAGGTLCAESQVIASRRLGPIRSNTPLSPEHALGSELRHDGHLMIDFGDDTLTAGRPHPMIDPGLRLARLAEEATDPSAGVILLDVVLGYGAQEDPAADLAPAIAAARGTAAEQGRDLAVVVSLCGTDADPQGLKRQADALTAAGAAVFLSNAAATSYAVDVVEGVVR